ncbi:hypothetical protein RV18_GL001932 [Enterococcus termitis]|nr:hypothetical protein RV18_GL001932 [Enterococcus termitis]
MYERKNKKMKVKKAFLLLLFLGPIILNHLVAFVDGYAEESQPASMAFYYEVLQPENQRNDVGYFDLLMKPNQKQTVKINLVNTGEESIAIDVRLNGAKSSSNGVIDYGPNELPKDESVDIDFTDIVKSVDTIEVPAKSSKELSINIDMPEQSFDGVIAGGIQLQAREDDTTVTQGAIRNRFAYIIGMLLTETDKKIEPNIVFRNVYAGQSNFRNTIFVTLSNVEKMFLEDVSINVQIRQKGKKDVLFSEEKEKMRMAPNSLLQFPVSMTGERMVAGEYTADISVSQHQKQWSWSEDFVISKTEADTFNGEDVDLQEQNIFDWKFMLIIFLLIVISMLMLLILFRMWRNKKSKKARRRPKKKTKK